MELDLLKKTLHLIGPAHRWRWFGLVALAVAASFAEAAAAFLLFAVLTSVTSRDQDLELPVLGDLSDRFPNVDPASLFQTVAFLVAGFFVLKGSLQITQVFLQNRLAHKTGSRVALALFRTYMAMPFAWHVRRNSSDLMRNALDSTLSFVSYVLVPLVGLTSESLVVAAMLVVLFVTAPLVTVIIIAVAAPLVYILMRGIRSRMTTLGSEAQQRYARVLQTMQQALQGVRDVKLFASEPYFAERFRTDREELGRSKYVSSTLVELPRAIIETALIGGVLIVMGVRVATGSRLGGSLAVLALIAYATLRLLPALNRILAHLSALRFGSAAVDEIYPDLEHDRSDLQSAGPIERIHPQEEIVFDNISYAYEGSEPAVRDMTFTLKAGSSVGIVGPTGGGKTTLIDLLTGLLEPTTGRVSVDGTDIRRNLPGWQASIGMVPQTVFLLDDTIRRNVAFGIEDELIDDEQVWWSLQLAQIDDLARVRPEGLDAMVGERGVRMSGGQRQRIAIARALYRRPDILILDEGTASLDSITEAAIVRAIAASKGDRTVIAVAHRLSTIESCDVILLVAEGRLIDAGTYVALMSRNAHFRAMAGGSGVS